MSNLKTALIFVIGVALGGGSTHFLIPNMSGGMADMDHSKMNMSSDVAADANTSNGAYKIAMDKMMGDMMVPYTGNSDVDFAAGMIPHHQGAIDMAKVVLQFGKDPEIRKLAEDVITAQEREITFMRNWLKANGN